MSMKRLRELTERLGAETSGSDRTLFGHSADNVAGADLVVYTSAVGENNVELAAARRLGIAVKERAEYLGIIAEDYDRVIAVAGSHGKTTTTGMMYSVFKSKKPTVHIGGDLKHGAEEESDAYFITEACEYRRSFLHLKPDIGIILNAELDHTDYYTDYDDIVSAFAAFAKKSKLAIYNGDDKGLYSLKICNALSFGYGEHNDFRAAAVAVDKYGRASFNIIAAGMNLGRIELSVCGKHNVYNALAAASAALVEGLPMSEIAERLKNFDGVKRRMEKLGEINGASVYTDYAHHPTEIRALIASAVGAGRLIIVFEPHTYSRTKDLFDGFCSCFSGADEVIFAPVFGSRESGGEVGSKELYEEVKKRQPALYFDGYGQINDYLLQNLNAGDTVVFTGAGTINQAGEQLVNIKR